MKDQETVQRFIQLRVQGLTYARISAELDVSKPTLIDWSRKHHHQIQNLRAIETEQLEQEYLASAETRIRALGEQLRRAQTELDKRDLTAVSTSRLFGLVENLRRQIQREAGRMRFVSTVDAIPADEYADQIQEWKP